MGNALSSRFGGLLDRNPLRRARAGSPPAKDARSAGAPRREVTTRELAVSLETLYSRGVLIGLCQAIVPAAVPVYDYLEVYQNDGRLYPYTFVFIGGNVLVGLVGMLASTQRKSWLLSIHVAAAFAVGCVVGSLSLLLSHIMVLQCNLQARSFEGCNTMTCSCLLDDSCTSSDFSENLGCASCKAYPNDVCSYFDYDNVAKGFNHETYKALFMVGMGVVSSAHSLFILIRKEHFDSIQSSRKELVLEHLRAEKLREEQEQMDAKMALMQPQAPLSLHQQQQRGAGGPPARGAANASESATANGKGKGKEAAAAKAKPPKKAKTKKKKKAKGKIAPATDAPALAEEEEAPRNPGTGTGVGASANGGGAVAQTPQAKAPPPQQTVTRVGVFDIGNVKGSLTEKGSATLGSSAGARGQAAASAPAANAADPDNNLTEYERLRSSVARAKSNKAAPVPIENDLGIEDVDDFLGSLM